MTAPVVLDPDAIGPSPRFRMATLATGVDVDLVNIGGGPCRSLMLLSTATGDLELTPASPIDGAATEKITITNLPAGTVLPKQVSKIVNPPAGLNGFLISIMWCLASLLCGCTAAQGQTVAAILDAACQGGVIVLGDPGAAPLCVAPELIEKWIETLNPPSAAMGARAPITPAARYAAAVAVGAKPIQVKP